jgi:hypothetical protein
LITIANFEYDFFTQTLKSKKRTSEFESSSSGSQVTTIRGLTCPFFLPQYAAADMQNIPKAKRRTNIN